MADLKLDILVIPTYNTKTLGIADASIYPDDPPIVTAPTIEITIPGFAKIVLPFSVNNFTVYSSGTLGLTDAGDDDLPLPDGVYHLKYSIAPAYLNYVEKSFVRIDRLQEKFDEAFMSLDMMECDRAIKTQSKIDLNSIYFFIQGAVSAANNCAIDEANKLYIVADKMLTSFINNSCGCSGNNYLLNYSTSIT
jgi:hypothetical protein